MKSGIYEFHFYKNGRRYIGSAVNLAARKAHHVFHLRRGTHANVHLQRTWNKYGEGHFGYTVLERCSRRSLLEREQWHLNQYSRRMLFNMVPVAGSHLGVKRTPAQVERGRQAAIRRAACPKERRLRSERAKKQWAEGNIGRKKAS